MFKTTKKIARAGVVSGLYVVLSMLAFPVASGFIQFRVGEALTVLPLIFPETSIGLAVGCAVTGIITGCPVIDTVFGSLITLFAGILTFYVGGRCKNGQKKFFIGGIFPIALNAFALPLVWYWCYGKLQFLYVLQALSLLLSQSVAVYGVGAAVFFPIEKIINKRTYKE